jgi:hypothetical protein
MSDQQKLPPGKPSTKAAERLAVIVDAAERAALSVIDDAEKEARRYLEEAQARADLIVAERLREAADMLERHRGEDLPEPRLRPVAGSEPIPAAGPIPAPDEDGPAPPSPDEVAEAAAEAESEEVAAPPEEESAPEPEPAPVPVALPDPEPQADAAAEPVTPPVAEPPKVEDRAPGSAAARLLATQMAVSGSSRKEIEMRLRNGFEIEDTSEILDAILGPEE